MTFKCPGWTVTVRPRSMSKKSSRKVPKPLNDGTKFVYRGRTQNPKFDYLTAFSACQGNKEAVNRALARQRLIERRQYLNSFNLSAASTTGPERKPDTCTIYSDKPRIETPGGESLNRGTGPACKEGPEAIWGIHPSGRE